MNDIQLRDSSVKNASSHKRNYAVMHRAFTDATVLKTKTSGLRAMLIRSPSKFLPLTVLF